MFITHAVKLLLKQCNNYSEKISTEAGEETYMLKTY